MIRVLVSTGHVQDDLCMCVACSPCSFWLVIFFSFIYFAICSVFFFVQTFLSFSHSVYTLFFWRNHSVHIFFFSTIERVCEQINNTPVVSVGPCTRVHNIHPHSFYFLFLLKQKFVHWECSIALLFVNLPSALLKLSVSHWCSVCWCTAHYLSFNGWLCEPGVCASQLCKSIELERNHCMARNNRTVATAEGKKNIWINTIRRQSAMFDSYESVS